VGVAPEGFEGTTLGVRPAIHVPMQSRTYVGTYNGLENRRDYWVHVFGRLKPGVTLDAARISLNGVIRPILTGVEAPLQQAMTERTMARFKTKEMVVEPGSRGQSAMHAEVRTPLVMLLSITAVVLLIACANIANLLLARGANRATEMGVRLALGASCRQLMTQLLAESLVLAVMGGVASLVVTSWTLRAIGISLPGDLSGTLLLTVQTRVIIFAGALAIVTGLLFGLFPALHSTRSDLSSSIRAGAGQIAGGHTARRVRTGLVTAQIALSTVLLISAGLFLKSLSNVSREDLGIRIDDVVSFSVSPLRVGYDTLRANALHARIEEELASTPGVTGVTSSLVPLLSGDSWGNDVRVQGFECVPGTDCNSRYSAVGANYFTMLGVSLLAGRDVMPNDRYGTTRIAIVNQAFADKFGLGRDAVGKFMGRAGGSDSLTIQIVGLAPNIKYNDRMISILSAAFAVIATLLAAIGLYGVLAYSVSQRTREIGVRMALGADARTVQRVVLRQVAALIAAGAAIDVLGAFGVGRAAQSLLFGLEGDDPLVFALSILVLSFVALGAGWLPALRASRMEPVRALRHE